MKDKDLWQQYTEKIKPLSKEEKPAELERQPPEKPSQKQRQATPDLSISASQKAPPFNPERPADIDKNNFERLKKGKMQIEATLDLHGMTHKQAFDLIHRKMRSWSSAGKRCVLVITGKGLRSDDPRNSLKNRFPEWLNEGELRSLMLAFCQAQPKDGGSGAYYVLLKANRERDI